MLSCKLTHDAPADVECHFVYSTFRAMVSRCIIVREGQPYIYPGGVMKRCNATIITLIYADAMLSVYLRCRLHLQSVPWRVLPR